MLAITHQAQANQFDITANSNQPTKRVAQLGTPLLPADSTTTPPVINNGNNVNAAQVKPTCVDLIKKYNDIIQSSAKASDLRLAYWGRAGCNYRLGRFQFTLDDYNFMLQKNWIGKKDMAMFYNNRGNAYFNLKSYGPAISNYTQAIGEKPNAVYYLNRGNAHQASGDYENAMQDYNKAISIDPNQADSYANRGNLYLNSDKNDLAMADYNRALNLGNLQGLRPATVYFYRGLSNVALNKNDDAMNDFNRAISLDQKNADSYIERGKLLIKNNQALLAIDDFNKAINLNKNFALAYQLRGLAKKSVGQNGDNDLQTAEQLKKQ
ncbi:MAG: tetratricopeptide repeat protein [Hydrotalea sp.]|nr:tetratricopeptide repeat protein [Hydrotalea sp.]